MKRKIYLVASVVYLIISIWLLFFFPFTSSNRLDASVERFVNTVPFESTSNYLRNAWAYPQWIYFCELLMNVGGNILLFVPMGVIIFNASPQKKWMPWLLGFLLSLTVETIQITVRVGNFDVDDIMLNSLGTLMGYWLCAHVPVLQLQKV